MATYLPVASASFSTTAFPNAQPLLSDGDDVVSRSGTLASGLGVIKRGTILKIVPATGVCTIPVAATDCNCILVDDVDATSATKACVVYVSGKVKADALIWPGALSHGDCADALRNYSILVESVVYTDGTLVKSAPSAAEEAEAKATVEKARAAAKEKEAAAKDKPAEGEKKPGEEEPKPSDSPWAYLTAEEREKHPEYAETPVPEPEPKPEEGTEPPPYKPPVTPPAPAKTPIKPPVDPNEPHHRK